jgi:hypothetical protein
VFWKVKKEVIAEIYRLASEEFKRIELHRTGTHEFAYKIDGDIRAEIGLVHNHLRGFLSLTPYVCLRHEGVEQILRSLNRLYSSRDSLTCSRNIGYIMPGRKFKEWGFQDGKDWRKSAIHMANVVKRYGVPFLQENMSLERITQLVRVWGGRELRYGISLFLLKRKKSARRVLLSAIENSMSKMEELGRKPSSNQALRMEYKATRKFFRKFYGDVDVRILDRLWHCQ